MDWIRSAFQEGTWAPELGRAWAAAPDGTFITMIGMLPLGILAFVGSRQHG